MARSGGLNNASRIINLICYLHDHPAGVSASTVRAQVAGYDPGQSDDAFNRQFRRDRKQLESLGFPVEKTDAAPEGPRYRLAAQAARQDRLDLDLKDISLLELCAANALESPSFFMHDQLASALSKLKSTIKLPPGATAGQGAGQEHGHGLAQGCGHGDGPQLDVAGPEAGQAAQQAVGAAEGHGGLEARRCAEGAVAASIGQALDQGCAIEFDYVDAAGHDSHRTGVPLRLFSYLGDLYALVFDLGKQATRNFKLQRFAAPARHLPSSPSQRAAALRHANDQPAILPFQYGSQRIEATAYISGKIAYRARSLTLSRGTLEDYGQGKLWTIEVADVHRFAQWCVENGPGILIVAPAQAAHLVRQGLAHVAGLADDAAAPAQEVQHGAS